MEGSETYTAPPSCFGMLVPAMHQRDPGIVRTTPQTWQSAGKGTYRRSPSQGSGRTRHTVLSCCQYTILPSAIHRPVSLGRAVAVFTHHRTPPLLTHARIEARGDEMKRITACRSRHHQADNDSPMTLSKMSRFWTRMKHHTTNTYLRQL